jgi:hypothetical protein|nr:MAG TPA: TFIIB zinc-binding [Caudoviricetes sp.]
MAEYVEREALKRLLVTEKFCATCPGLDEPGGGCAECVADYIESLPAADVAPVRRGHWVRVGNGTTCSECMHGLLRINGKQSEWVDLSGMPYCPNCGADMQEVPNDD